MATSSIAVALFLSSYATSQAANYTLIKPRLYAQSENVSYVEVEPEGVSVSAADYKEDLGIDPTFTESLVTQGFSPAQIQNIFASASLKLDYNKMPLSE